MIQIGSLCFNVFTMFWNSVGAQEWYFTAQMVWWCSIPSPRWGLWWACPSPNKPFEC